MKRDRLTGNGNKQSDNKSLDFVKNFIKQGWSYSRLIRKNKDGTYLVSFTKDLKNIKRITEFYIRESVFNYLQN